METQLTPFEGIEIRKIEHNGEWFFSVVDVIQILTESKDASNYWTMLKKRESELSTICGKFKFLAPDGKMRPTDCANTEGVFRILMSVPSLRDVKDNQEYAILTATIAKGTFGLNPSEHAKLKGLERQNLRDHMTPLELIFTALSEEITKRVTVQNDAQGFNENYEAAQKGGQITGGLVAKAEKDIGEKVVSSDNFLGLKGSEDKPLLTNE